MPATPTVHQRRRAPTADELASIPWLALLTPRERQQIESELVVSDPQPGDYVCRVGRPATYWFGVVSGLLKMSSDNESGQTMTFTGVPPGGWFGEGTALKREVYRYNIQPLRASVVADPDSEIAATYKAVARKVAVTVAKKARDFALADAIRDELAAQGVELLGTQARHIDVLPDEAIERAPVDSARHHVVDQPREVAGERVFVMSVDRVVHAFDVLDGRRLWTLQRPGEALTLAQPGVLAAHKNTLVAGIGHWFLGSVDWALLGSLLIGSLPGIWLGSRLTHHTPDRVIRSLLSVLLAWAGTKLVLI